MFFVYILKCADGTLYTGSTKKQVERRVYEHNNLKSGAKYTRARRPVELIYQEKCKDYAHSRSREAEIKRMTREEKLEFLKNNSHHDKKDI